MFFTGLPESMRQVHGCALLEDFVTLFRVQWLDAKVQGLLPTSASSAVLRQEALIHCQTLSYDSWTKRTLPMEADKL